MTDDVSFVVVQPSTGVSFRRRHFAACFRFIPQLAGRLVVFDFLGRAAFMVRPEFARVATVKESVSVFSLSFHVCERLEERLSNQRLHTTSGASLLRCVTRGVRRNSAMPVDVVWQEGRYLAEVLFHELRERIAEAHGFRLIHALGNLDSVV